MTTCNSCWSSITELRHCPVRQAEGLPEAEHRASSGYAELNKEQVSAPASAHRPRQGDDDTGAGGKAQVKNGPHLAGRRRWSVRFRGRKHEAAIALAARIPQARLGGAVEIRPVEKYFDLPQPNRLFIVRRGFREPRGLGWREDFIQPSHQLAGFEEQPPVGRPASRITRTN